MRGGEGGGARGLPVGNKVITQRWQERCQRIHLMKLKNMQAAVDNKAPRDFPHLRQNRKKAQVRLPLPLWFRAMVATLKSEVVRGETFFCQRTPFVRWLLAFHTQIW